MGLHVPPDRAMMAAFVDAVFRHADPDTYAVLKAFDAADSNVFPADGIKISSPRLVDFAFNRAKQTAGCGRMAVFCPPVATFRDSFSIKGRWSATTEDLANGVALSVDADKTPASARETLTGLIGAPTLTAASGGLWIDPETGEIEEKLHLHWRLDKPTRDADDHLKLHEARWLACMIVGGDPTLAPIVHPLRWPGSVHTKDEPRLSRIVDKTENEIDLDETLGILRATWKGPAFNAPNTAPRPASVRTANHDDIASAVAVIPNDDLSWDAWKRIGMAIWAATGGQGFDVFDDWSRRSSKYDPATTAMAWRKIDRSPPSEIGAGSIFFMANEADPTWVKPSDRVDDGEFAEVAQMQSDAGFGDRVDNTIAISSPPAKIPPISPPDTAHLPGLLGDVVDWIVATDRRPNRLLALGAALTVLGTLMGRRVSGPTTSGTHLYVIALAASGAGKDHALSQVPRLIKAANAEQLIGPSGFMSYSAVIRFIARQPLSVCVMDELGAFLKKLAHKKAGVHEQGITAILRTAWGSSFQAMRTPEWSASPSEEIQSPALSIYGVSVPEEFFSAMQGSDVANGFLNRFLMIEAERAPRREDECADPFTVPDDLRRALLRFYSDANQIEMADPWDIRPRVLPWIDGAETIYRTLEDMLDRFRNDHEIGPFYARTTEMAVRLATIRAAGTGFHGVGPSDMLWGRDVALWSAQRMIAAAAEHMAGNEFAAYQNRIAAFMRRKGEPVTRRDMQMAIKSELTVRQLEDAIATMVQSGRIVPMAAKREQGKQGRPPPTHYRLAEF